MQIYANLCISSFNNFGLVDMDVNDVIRVSLCLPHRVAALKGLPSSEVRVFYQFYAAPRFVRNAVQNEKYGTSWIL